MADMVSKQTIRASNARCRGIARETEKTVPNKFQTTPNFGLFHVVVLKRASHGMAERSVGTIVHVCEPGSYEVEFNEYDETADRVLTRVVTLDESELMALP